MVPFLTHIDGVRTNLFSKYSRQKITPTMVNQQLFIFFTVKLDAANSFPSNTAEVRPIYLKMGHIMRQPVFVICEQQRPDQPAHPRSLISVFLVRCLDSNEILRLKLCNSIGTYTVSPNCQFVESFLLLHVHLFKSKFHPAGMVLHRFCFPVSMFL